MKIDDKNGNVTIGNRSEIFKKIVDVSDNIENDLINIRRKIHQNPELGNKEFKTRDLIIERLNNIGYTNIEIINETGVVAILEGESKDITSGNDRSRTILFRSDIDALPIKEENDSEFKSLNDNMHACGHDAHIAWGLGTAEVLYSIKDSIKGRVKFVFQPAEEIGGARKLIHLGVLRNPDVDVVLGGHVWPEIEVGKIGIANKVAMSSGTSFKIEIIGKGGHGAEPYNCIDPIAIGSEVYSSIQKLLYKINTPKDPTIISVCSFNAGNSRNIIPDICTIEGTIRAISKDRISDILDKIDKITLKITEAYGAKYELDRGGICLPVVNDSSLVKLMQNSSAAFLDEGDISIIDYPAMTSDDFSEYTAKLPGLYIYIGSTSNGSDITEKLHSSKFDIDESLIKVAVRVFSGFIIDCLS